MAATGARLPTLPAPSSSRVPAAPSRAAVTSISTFRSAPGAKSRTSDRGRRATGAITSSGRAGCPCCAACTGSVADLESLAANLESVLDRESRRILGSPDQAGRIDREEADAVVIDQPVRVAERSLGRQRLVQIAGCGPSGARSIGWSIRSPVSG